MLLLQALLFFLLSISVTAIPAPLNRKDGIWMLQFHPELNGQFYIKVEHGLFSSIYPGVQKTEVATLFTNTVWSRATEPSTMPRGMRSLDQRLSAFPQDKLHTNLKKESNGLHLIGNLEAPGEKPGEYDLGALSDKLN
ncbi:hypothetical protein F5887DRAFT_966026 [Amanita rubescens]|nr:hypothetical protein F5887DRAFT_966026 [Amanita rubescens]